MHDQHQHKGYLALSYHDFKNINSDDFLERAVDVAGHVERETYLSAEDAFLGRYWQTQNKKS